VCSDAVLEHHSVHTAGLQAWRAALLFVAAGFLCRAITSAGHDIENLITALGERGLGDALPPSLHVEV
jgi:hypothetical protein